MKKTGIGLICFIDSSVYAIQLRQPVLHRGPLFYLELLILQHDAAVREMKFQRRDHATGCRSMVRNFFDGELNNDSHSNIHQERSGVTPDSGGSGLTDEKLHHKIQRIQGGWTPSGLILVNQGLATIPIFGVGVNLILFLTRVLCHENVSATNTVRNWTGTVYMFSLVGAFLSDSYWERYIPLGDEVLQSHTMYSNASKGVLAKSKEESDNQLSLVCEVEKARINEDILVALDFAIPMLQPKGHNSALHQVLVSTTHIGIKEYSEALQKDLESYDCVLYEMVSSRENLENKGNPAATNRLAGRSQGFNFIGCVQRQMARILALDFQLGCLNYYARNWYHADLDIERFKLLHLERGDNFFIVAREMTIKSTKAYVQVAVVLNGLDPVRSKLVWASRLLPMPFVRFSFVQADGVKLLTPRISPTTTHQYFHLLSEICLCVWLLSYYEPTVEYVATFRTFTIRNLMSKGTFGPQMLWKLPWLSPDWQHSNYALISLCNSSLSKLCKPPWLAVADHSKWELEGIFDCGMFTKYSSSYNKRWFYLQSKE